MDRMDHIGKCRVTVVGCLTEKPHLKQYTILPCTELLGETPTQMWWNRQKFSMITDTQRGFDFSSKNDAGSLLNVTFITLGQ